MRSVFFSLCLFSLLVTACEKSESREAILGKELLKDGVITATEGFRLLDATNKWREDDYLIEVPLRQVAPDVLHDHSRWVEEPLKKNDEKAYREWLQRAAFFTAQRPDPGPDRNVIRGFGRGCWYYVIVGKGEKAFIVRSNY